MLCIKNCLFGCVKQNNYFFRKFLDEKKNMYMRRVCYKWEKVHTVRLYFFEKKKTGMKKITSFVNAFNIFLFFFLQS